MSALSQEKRAQAFQHLVAHLKDAEAHEKLFELIEERGHLAAQVRHVQSYQASSRDIERHALQAAIDEDDWGRFLRYALTALNLREVAAALAEEPILRTLAQLGHRKLALNLAGQLPDRLGRARARAVVLAATGGNATRDDEELRRIVEDLDQAPPPASEGEAESWLETIRALARLLDPERLQNRWAAWIGALERSGDTETGERACNAWQAVAEGWLERDAGEGSGLWPALASMRDPERVLSFLPARLAASRACGLEYLEEPLPPPFQEDEQLLWHVRVAILGRQVREDPAFVEKSRALLGCVPVSWTLQLVETGRELWPRLGVEALRGLRIEDPAIRTSLLVVALEGKPRAEVAEAARDALEEITDGSPQLHWTLRYLATRPASRCKQRQVRLVARHLERLRYDVDPADLARFLDLVAAEAAPELRRQLEEIVWSPTISGQKLRRLAASADHRAVLEALLDRAEEYAAAVTLGPAEGFDLRCELLVGLASRLCRRAGDLEALEKAVPRLLPDEEDRLRVAAVETLLGETGPRASRCSDLAREVAAAIRSGRLRLLAQLRLTSAPATLEELLDPAELYAAVARTDVAEDERLALASLQELPVDPAALARDRISRIRDPDRRVQALADLAWHTLAFQGRAYPRGQQDAIAALEPLSQAVGGTTSSEQLLAMTPELVALGAQGGTQRAMAELQEAFLRVLRLETVAPSRRLETLATLVARIGPVLLAGEDPPRPSRCRAASALYRWVVELPNRSERETADFREQWPALLPVLLAASGRQPPLVAAYLRHPFRARLCCEWLPAVTRRLGFERTWTLLGRLERRLPRWLVRRVRTPWARGVEAFESWLDPAQRAVLATFLDADDNELRRHAEEVLEEAEPGALETTTLVYLLSARTAELGEDGSDPAAAPRAADLLTRLLRRLSNIPARDHLCLWLIRQGWLRGTGARQAAELIADPASVCQAKVLRALADGDPHWVKALSELIRDYGLDPLDPLQAPLRRALRQGSADGDASLLACATRDAFLRGGRREGESALRFWLDVFLGCKGEPGDFKNTAAAKRQAQTL